MKIGLHRAGDRPAWLDISPGRHNVWQRLAVRTNGIVTPGNVCTLIGFGIVVAGLSLVVAGQFLVAFCLIVVGRLCDVLDGWLAERTGTKSSLGEKLDAGFDKLATLLAAVALLASAVIPWWVALILALPHLVIAAYGARALWRGRQLHPVRTGKISMALLWISLGFLVLAKAWPAHSWLISSGAYLIGAVSLIIGCRAAGQYARVKDVK